MIIKYDSIFNIGNPYGYKININHPRVRDKYNRFKKWKDIPENEPMSDEIRFEFEKYLLSNRKEGKVDD